SYVPPSRNHWDLLFQPMFDELLNPPPSVVNQAFEVIALIAEVIPSVHANSTGSPSSTTVDQDAPSLSKSHTTTEIQSSVIPQDIGDDNLDIEVAHIGNDPLFGVPIPKVISAQSSSTASPQSIVRLKVSVRRIQTDNGSEFANQTLRDYYEEVGIFHETSVARSPQQNVVVERRNHTPIEVAHTMLIYAQAPLFLWAEAMATAFFTQNRSI
nr:putative ribonuclease H-like domain-containing protein [Tanacetum cinerariifolium]